MATDPLWARNVANAQFMTYDPTQGWQGYSQDLGAFRHMFDDQQLNLAPEIQAYLQANGYSGPLQGAAQYLTPMGLGARDKADWNAENLGMSTATGMQSASRIPELDAFLQQRGLTLQSGFSQEPGATQTLQIQRLLNAGGDPVAVDSYNTRKAGLDKFMNFAVPAALAIGSTLVGGQALGMIGSGSGAAGAGGTGTLGAGAPSAGITTQGIGATELAGLGLSNPAPLALAPTFGPGAALTTAGITAADLGGLSSAGLEAAGFANPIALAPGAGGLGSYATLGAGATAPQVTTPGIGASETAGLGLSNTAPLTGVPATAGGGGLLSSIVNSPVGQAVGSVADAVGGGQNLAGIIGGIAGATQGGRDQTATTQSRTDPRFDPYLYGDNGFLSQLQQQFNATKSGTNADITAGMNMLRSLYTSPEYSQGYQDMRTAGQGLLSRGVAGNPFTMGGQAPQFGRNAPAMPEAQANPFLGLLGQGQAQMPAGLLGMFGRNGG